jgi:hypothetical protein
MREVRAGEPLFTEGDEPERLLFTEEFATLLGVTPATLRGYHADARRARRLRKPAHFPPPDEVVRRTSIKANRQPVVAQTPVWRESKAKHYADNRLGPGGRPRAQLGQEAG